MWIGWVDSNGVRLVAREERLGFLLRKADGTYVIDLAGNKGTFVSFQASSFQTTNRDNILTCDTDSAKEIKVFDTIADAHAWLASPMSAPPPKK